MGQQDDQLIELRLRVATLEAELTALRRDVQVAEEPPAALTCLTGKSYIRHAKARQDQAQGVAPHRSPAAPTAH